MARNSLLHRSGAGGAGVDGGGHAGGRGSCAGRGLSGRPAALHGRGVGESDDGGGDDQWVESSVDCIPGCAGGVSARGAEEGGRGVREEERPLWMNLKARGVIFSRIFWRSPDWPRPDATALVDQGRWGPKP